MTAGKFFADAEKSKGLRTTEDAKFYGENLTKYPPRHALMLFGVQLSIPAATHVRSDIDQVPAI